MDRSKSKSFADDNLNMTENIAGKEENAGYKHFLLSSQCFQKAP